MKATLQPAHRPTIQARIPLAILNHSNVTAEQQHQILKAEGLVLENLSDYGADCLLYTSPSPRDGLLSRMPSSA